MKFTAEQIAAYLGGIVVGDKNATVHTFAKIEEGKPGTLSFLANPKYTPYIYSTASSIVLVNNDFEPAQPLRTTLIKVDNAYDSLARLMQLYTESLPKPKGISSLACVAPTAQIGSDVYIAPYAVVGEHVVIGDRCRIYSHVSIGDEVVMGDDVQLFPHVTIYEGCQLGSHVTIHAGSVIGADGFGFAPSGEGYDKIPQIGNVVIGDHVEIGANSCIDRATMGSTRIGEGVKIDNLVQVAHNVTIGDHTVMAAQTGVAGSSKVGAWCMFGGQVGIAGHLTIGDHVSMGAQAGAAGNIKPNQTCMGTPAFDARAHARSYVVHKRLPQLAMQLDRLCKEVEQLKAAANKK